MRGAWLAGVVAAVAAGGPRAAAEPIRWRAPAACGDGAALVARVTELAGRAPAADELGADVEVVADGGGYRVTLRYDVGGGEVVRTVAARSCAAAIDAAAFVLAMAIQEEHGEDAEASVAEAAAPAATGDEPAPEPGTGRESDPSAVTAAEPARAPRRGLRLRASAGAGAGMLPGAAPGVALAVARDRDRVRVEALAAAWRPGTSDVGRGAGARVGLHAAGARVCGVRAAWRACAGATVGRMRGEGVGVSEPRAAARRWSAAAASVAWSRPVGPVALVAEIEGLITLDRPRFLLEDGTVLFAPAPVAARAWLGIEVEVP